MFSCGGLIHSAFMTNHLRLLCC